MHSKRTRERRGDPPPTPPAQPTLSAAFDPARTKAKLASLSMLDLTALAFMVDLELQKRRKLTNTP